MSRRIRHGATFRVRGFTERVCAGPKEGAVTVANTTGCPPTEVGNARAAHQARLDELVGVGAMGLRAGRAEAGDQTSEQVHQAPWGG